MAWYQQARRAGGTLQDVMHRLYCRATAVIIEGLDAVRNEPTLPREQRDDVEQLYRWALRFPGSGFDAVAEPAFIATLVAEKQRKGLV
jgi:hypothetical protein